MNRIGPCPPRYLQHRLDIQVWQSRAVRQPVGVIGIPNVTGRFFSGSVDGNSGDAHLTASPADADRNLTTVGNKHALDIRIGVRGHVRTPAMVGDSGLGKAYDEQPGSRDGTTGRVPVFSFRVMVVCKGPKALGLPLSKMYRP